ncbi:MAG: hypothetical protein ACLFTT_08340 [Candidatus Hydrogenedentota bacterium]
MIPLDATSNANVTRANAKPFFVFEDRPRPGAAYVAGNGILLAIALGMTLVMRRPEAGLYAVAATSLGLLLAAYLLLVLHAAFSTVYTLTAGLLDVRCGVLGHAEIRLDEITRIDMVQSLPRVVGHSFGGRSYGNRFFTGLRLERNNGRAVFLTPSDTQAFAELLHRRRRGETPETQRTTPGG